MNVKYIDELIRVNNPEINRVARLYSGSTTTAVNIFKEIAANDSVKRVVLYTDSKELKAFVFSEDYNGKLLTVFDSCDLNVAQGYRVGEVGHVLSILLAAKQLKLEYCEVRLSTPYQENNRRPLEDYPTLIKSLKLKLLTEDNIMDFMCLMSNSFCGMPVSEVDQLCFSS